MSQANEGTPPEGEDHNATNSDDATSPNHSHEKADSTGPKQSHGLTGEERLRAILRGDIDPEQEGKDADKNRKERTAAEDDSEAIAKQFDPDTGEFLEDLESEPETKPAPKPDAETAPEEEDGEDQGADGQSNEDKDGEAEDDDAGDEDGEDDDKQEEQQEQQAEQKERKRISIKRGRLNDQDFAVVQLADREKISLDEARERLFGQQADRTPAPQEEGDTKDGEPGKDSQPDVTPDTLQAEIDTLVQDRAKAAKALDFEKSNELSDKIHDLKTQQRELRQEIAGREQAAAKQLETGVQASIDNAVEMYPDVANEKSDLFKAIDAEIAARKKSNPGFFKDAEWPEVLAIKVAKRLGIAPVVSTAPKPAEKKPAPSPAPTPKKTARPAPNPAPGTATSGNNATTEASLETELKKATAARDQDGIKRVMRKMEEHEASRSKRP